MPCFFVEAYGCHGLPTLVMVNGLLHWMSYYKEVPRVQLAAVRRPLPSTT